MAVKGFFGGLFSAVDDKSTMSVNSITLLISALIGFLLGLTICFVLIFDVVTNGYIKTDLIDMGVFLLCSGGYIGASGIPKTIIDSRLNARYRLKKKKFVDGNEYEADEEVEEEEK